MAHNVRLRANLAAWGIGTTVLDTEFNAIDQKVFESVNGDLGGVWAPSTVIEVGGSGVKLTGPVRLAGAASAPAAGDVNVGSGVVDWQGTKWEGTPTIATGQLLSLGLVGTGILEIDGPATALVQIGSGAGGVPLDIYADTTFKSVSTVTFQAQIKANAGIDATGGGSAFDAAVFDGDVTLNSGSSFLALGDVEFRNPVNRLLGSASAGLLVDDGASVIVSGLLAMNQTTTQLLWPVQVITTDANATVTNKLYVTNEGAPLSAQRDYALDLSDAAIGMVTHVYNTNATHSVRVLNGVAGSSIATLTVGTFGVFRHNGSAWVRMFQG